MKFQELELDEHNIATHYIDRTGLEVWCENEYHEDGRIKDVHITKMKFPNLKYWLLIIGFIVGIVFLVYLYSDFIYDKRTECSNGDLAACVEYNYLINP